MKFRVARHARGQISDIFWAIATDDPAAARRWLIRLDGVLERIEAFPESGRIVPEYDIPELREVMHGAYRVVYFVGERTLTVSSVIHGARMLSLGRDLQPSMGEDE